MIAIKILARHRVPCTTSPAGGIPNAAGKRLALRILKQKLSGRGRRGRKFSENFKTRRAKRNGVKEVVMIRKKIEEFWGKFLCKFGWHDWERVPFTWEDDGPSWARSAVRTGTNAECTRCSRKEYLNEPLTEESVRRLREAGLHDSAEIAERYLAKKGVKA